MATSAGASGCSAAAQDWNISENSPGSIRFRSMLERVPTRWNHLVEKNSRKINGLGMILSQKWFPLLRIML